MTPASLLTVLTVGNFIFVLLAISLSSKEDVASLAAWSIAQWMPVRSLRGGLQERAWKSFERFTTGSSQAKTEIPFIHIQDHKEDLLSFLEETYGKDWRRRPVLLKGLWGREALESDARRLSLRHLLQENLTVPFFTDARVKSALTPDGRAPVGEIVANISGGVPHKIGTQFLVQNNPQLIQEVAPIEIVTELFGNYFTPDHVRGTGPFHLLPALTTVPLFVASGKQVDECDTGGNHPDGEAQPYTSLHCEPIGNVAVQLSGRKRWTLIQPEFSYLIKPSIAPDGRAFFASWADEYDGVPTYTAVTEAGDAVWVPTWTWHRVDYVESNDIAIGGSLFHFRAKDFVTNNPLFALLVIPALFSELLGAKTQ